MDSAFDIPDATDWLQTPLKGLATVENALHCSICKDFYDTPMITSCCHTFCSKCIRTSLSADGKCPACRTADQANKLRNNWAVQELVSSFLEARPAALEVARKEQEAAQEVKRPAKRKRVVLSSEDEPVRTTRSKSRRIAASQESQPEIVEVDDSDEDETFQPEEPAPNDGLVECPLGCGKRMKIEAVEPHLDRCEEEQKQASRSKSRTPVNGFGHTNSAGHRAGAQKPQDRLPELSYSLFTEAKLSRKLQELGIPSTGSKQLMIRRHKEWVNIWNAHCDSNRPRSKRELLQELDSWERTQGGKAPNSNGLASTIMKKDFDANGWASSNKSDFSRLIADAKRKKSNPAVEAALPKDEDAAGTAQPTLPTSESAVEDFAAGQSTIDLVDDNSTGPVEGAGVAPEPGPEASAGYRHQPPSLPTASSQGAAHQRSSQLPREDSDGRGLQFANSLGRKSSTDEHAVRQNTGEPCELPAHMHTSQTPTKKMPMFAMPREAISDGDAGFSGP